MDEGLAREEEDMVVHTCHWAFGHTDHRLKEVVQRSHGKHCQRGADNAHESLEEAGIFLGLP